MVTGGTVRRGVPRVGSTRGSITRVVPSRSRPGLGSRILILTLSPGLGPYAQREPSINLNINLSSEPGRHRLSRVPDLAPAWPQSWPQTLASDSASSLSLSLSISVIWPPGHAQLPNGCPNGKIG